jgi:uncharacterized protein DUF4236
MGFGFRKRRGLLGGLLAINLSKSGLGASLGVPGARLGIDSTGHSYFRGALPGTGLFYRARLPHDHARDHLGRYCFAWVVIIGFACWLFLR